MADSIEDNVIALKAEYPKPLKINDRDMTDDEYEAKILEWATNKNTLDLDEEANGYKVARQSAYASIQDQLDMQYWDSVNGTTTWKDHIAQVKSDNPKPS